MPKILGVNTPKHGKVWPQYKKLKKIRDDIIHIKTNDRKSSGCDIQTIWDRLVIVDPPHEVAKKMIEHYFKEPNETPNWLKNCPF